MKIKYNELVDDYNALIDQDAACAERLSATTEMLRQYRAQNELTQQELEKAKEQATSDMWWAAAKGFGSGTMTGILFILLLLLAL